MPKVWEIHLLSVLTNIRCCQASFSFLWKNISNYTHIKKRILCLSFYIILAPWWFPSIVILVFLFGTQYYSILINICTSFTTKNEHLFICLLGIYMSSFVKHLFQSWGIKKYFCYQVAWVLTPTDLDRFCRHFLSVCGSHFYLHSGPKNKGL